MATASSTLAWRIPRTEESGGLQPMESQRGGHRLCCGVACPQLMWRISTTSVVSRENPGTATPVTSFSLSCPVITRGSFSCPIPTLLSGTSHRKWFHNALHILLLDSGFVCVSQDSTQNIPCNSAFLHSVPTVHIPHNFVVFLPKMTSYMSGAGR